MKLNDVCWVERVLAKHAAEVVCGLAVLEPGHERHGDGRDVMIGARGLLLHLLLQAPDHVTATWLTRQHGQQHLNTSINSYIMT